MKKKGEKQQFEKIGEFTSIYKRGETWWANQQYQGKQTRRSLKTRSKKRAAQLVFAHERQLRDGIFPNRDPEFDRITIEQVIEKFLKTCEVEGRAVKTLAKYRQVLTLILQIAIQSGLKYVDQIDPQFVDDYRATRKRIKRKPKTIFNEVNIIRQLILYAKRRSLIDKDPLEGYVNREPKNSPQPCWTEDEVKIILENCHEIHQPVFRFLAESGVRIGELKWLTWDDIDHEKNLIHIRPKDGWTTKTGNVRSIPISETAKTILNNQSRKHRWVFTAQASRKYPLGDHQISERRLLESLKRTLKKLDLQGHLHTFRHYFISRAVVKGISEPMIRKWVGHVDAETLKHYTHIADQFSQEAMRKLQS